MTEREPLLNERQAILCLLQHVTHSLSHCSSHPERNQMIYEAYEAFYSLGIDMDVVCDVHAMFNMHRLLDN